MTKVLYTTAEVKKVREKLFEDQESLCKLTKLPISDKDTVLDHDHKSQYVRGVLHRQSNAVLGKIENMWTRYLKWWYPDTLSNFLRKCADYLDADHGTAYLHPGWLNAAKIEFNRLTVSQKNQVLSMMGSDTGKNDKERKLLFSNLLLTREFDFVTIRTMIETVTTTKE